MSQSYTTGKRDDLLRAQAWEALQKDLAAAFEPYTRKREVTSLTAEEYKAATTPKKAIEERGAALTPLLSGLARAYLALSPSAPKAPVSAAPATPTPAVAPVMPAPVALPVGVDPTTTDLAGRHYTGVSQQAVVPAQMGEKAADAETTGASNVGASGGMGTDFARLAKETLQKPKPEVGIEAPKQEFDFANLARAMAGIAEGGAQAVPLVVAGMTPEDVNKQWERVNKNLDRQFETFMGAASTANKQQFEQFDSALKLRNMQLQLERDQRMEALEYMKMAHMAMQDARGQANLERQMKMDEKRLQMIDADIRKADAMTAKLYAQAQQTEKEDRTASSAAAYVGTQFSDPMTLGVWNKYKDEKEFGRALSETLKANKVDPMSGLPMKDAKVKKALHDTMMQFHKNRLTNPEAKGTPYEAGQGRQSPSAEELGAAIAREMRKGGGL